MKRKIAIVGKGPTASAAPFYDETWEIWGLAWVKYPRQTKSFDIHGLEFWTKEKCLSIWNKEPTPVIGFENGSYPDNEQFPFKEVANVFGNYFESSIAYMLAMAILEKPDNITIWGVHMETRTEYAEQLANLEYLIGYGRGLGVKIEVCPGAPVMMSSWVAGRYGVDLKHRFKGEL